MSWILAIAISPARTWAARAALTPGAVQTELIHLTRAMAPGTVVSGFDGSDEIRTEAMPSAVWSDGNQVLAGVAALDRASLAPHGLVLDPFALLTPAAVAPGATSAGPDPIALISSLLATAYQLAVTSTGSTPERTLVTHPDDWTIDQISALRRAASRAGISIDPVPEPIAVAAAYRAFGGEGTRLLMLDADRNTASAVARMGSMFVVLGTAGADETLAAGTVLPGLAQEALGQPGVRPELLDEVLVTGEALEPDLMTIGQDLIKRPASELPTWALAPGALHYDRSVHEERPKPVPPAPPVPAAPPPSPPVPRANHAVPDPKSKRPPLVPLLIGILILLVLAELLFLYWPF